jgi:hypothetical protein
MPRATKRFLLAFIVTGSLVATGCGGGGEQPSTAAHAIGATPCRSNRFEVKLHGIDCESADAMIVMLDGRVRHQSLTLAGDHGLHVVWKCRSKSLAGPLSCHDGKRYFIFRRPAS